MLPRVCSGLPSSRLAASPPSCWPSSRSATRFPSRTSPRATSHSAAPPERVFAACTDVEAFPTWRSDVQGVDVTTRTPQLQWRERGSDGTIAFEVQESEPPRRLVTRIADRTLPFGGAWTFTLQPDGGGTKLTITENGEVYNPLFRVMSRYVFGYTATIDRYRE